MPPIRFAGQQIESWNPAMDARSFEAGRVLVLDGKNYVFDSKGPKSGFGHRLVTGGQLGKLSDIQSIDIHGQTLLASSKGLYRQEFALPALRDVLEPSTYWQTLTTFFEIEHPDQFNKAKWTGVYLSGATFVANRDYGFYQVNRTDATIHDVPGAPDQVIALGVVGSRLIALTPISLVWSAPGDGFDFNPQTGGAGFQLLSQYMPDEPIGMTFNQKEIVVWGRESAMSVELIGGQAVFRFDSLDMELYPLGPFAITHYLQDSSFILTKHGLAVVNGSKMDMSVTPEFNQFVRTYMSDNYQLEVRLDYIQEDDLLYVSFADSQPYYLRSHVLSVSIGKWGSFDENHLGICRFGSTRGSTGYADIDSYLHKFTDTPDREVRGLGLIGLDSFIDIGYLNTPDMILTADTTLEIQELMISCKHTFPSEYADLWLIDWQGDGLYWQIVYGDFETVDYNLNGSEGLKFGFAYFDLQFESTWLTDVNDPSKWLGEDWLYDLNDDEVVVDDNNWYAEELILSDEFNEYGEEEWSLGDDWNYPLTPNEDWNMSWLEASAEDWNIIALDESEDYLIPPVTSVWVPEGLDYEDWDVPDGDDDWNGPYSFRSFIYNKIQIFSSLTGDAFDWYFDPSLAIEHGDRALYTTLTAGRFQFLRISAIDRWDYYHLTSFDATVNYQGQYS